MIIARKFITKKYKTGNSATEGQATVLLKKFLIINKMMNNHSWGWGMGWGMWIIPIAVILLVVFFMRGRRRK